MDSNLFQLFAFELLDNLSDSARDGAKNLNSTLIELLNSPATHTTGNDNINLPSC